MSFSLFESSAEREAAAIRRTQAVIEFTMDGRIIEANANFLNVVGYRPEEVVGQHHSMFVEPRYASSDDYRAFWAKLGRGEAIEAEFLRIAKGGAQVWLQAIYTPILGRSGKPEKVIKFATDITARKGVMANYEGQVAAIRKSQAVIEFDLAGIVLDANETFLSVLGYSLADIKGKHHSMFVDPQARSGEAYTRFWQKLGRGEYDDGQYLRIGKGGKQVWIQASYNPILDALGKPYKVVKYATDITANKQAQDMLSQAVEETQSVVQAAKSRDLTQRVSLQGKSGAIGELCGGVNELLESVADIVRTVSDISSNISAGATRIGNDSRELAQRTEEQATSLEETAATTEELAASVKQSSERTRDATTLGAGANEEASRGGTIVAEAVVAMARIEKASSDISDIIRVIDDIAFQTNLLALNAAVEAARAGDAGKGFAVVASEVRTLAQRSGEAAKNISTLISNSTQQVANGVKLVKDAGAALAGIVDSSTNVASALGDISSASHEQANGIEEVAKVVAHMDEMTQRNSLMAEQSATIARQLEQATGELQTMVQDFKIDDRPRADLASRPDRVSGLVTQLRQVSAPPARPAATAPRPQRRAAGGSAGGWSEF
ncbi:methyl-accepting chemotaxis sensory transducer with Pas/Pac sensor [Bosea sp. OK403]|nr:methyl-accepting chemotaxis sensory transducer with Pas/Pac sensor [Bosea sp. OK403]